MGQCSAPLEKGYVAALFSLHLDFYLLYNLAF